MVDQSVLILGWARHGKDAAAEFLHDHCGLPFRSSSLFLAEKVVRRELARHGLVYETLDDCYADRVNYRAVWRAIIEEYNRDDPARLAKAILSEARCYVGMRMQREYEASRPLFDHVLWIDSSKRGLPPEPADSMNIACDPGDMLVIENSGTLAEFHSKLAAWAAVAGLSRR